jgi:hypothetical protein
LFADFLTIYYVDHEPESVFSLKLRRNLWVTRSARATHCKINVWLSFRALARYFRPNEPSRRFVRWMLMLYKRSLLSRK